VLTQLQLTNISIYTTPRPIYPREIPGAHCTGG